MLSFPAYDCTQYDFGQVVAIEIPATVDLDTGTPSAFFDVKYPSGRTIRWSPVTIDETGDHPVAQYTLARGDLRYKGVQRYIWKDRSARNGLGLRNGLELVRMKVTKDIDTGGLFFAHIKVKAYGDFSAAIEPEMTTQFFGVEDTAILTATWTQRRSGWILRAADQLVDSGNFQCVTGP